jgi:tRNA(fMet)-specific endonuclease VapC
MILFDTDVCIEILRGNNKVVKRRQEYPGEVSISFMTVAELVYGANISGRPEENRILVEKFLLTVGIIQSDMLILKRFGEIKAGLYKKNMLVPEADIFIAATAIEKAEAIITGNVKHFDRIDGLKIENWIK